MLPRRGALALAGACIAARALPAAAVLLGLGGSLRAGRHKSDFNALSWGVILIYVAVLGVLSGTPADYFDPET
ncbi:MAG: hypothetical protein ACO3CC_18960, partial [Alphaproteobacteria bacterium]